jgi:CDP-glucose 4,6-dehydratase
LSVERELHWSPALTLTDAMRLTWQWHAAWRDGQDMHRFTLEQIHDFGARE